MAWIKFDSDLIHDPRVYRMASRMCHASSVTDMSRSRITVIGALVCLWTYAQPHIAQDDTLECSVEEINQIVGIAEFCEICPPDWLQVVNPNRVKLPNFLAHNGIQAKRKALAAQRQIRSRTKRDKVVTQSELPDQDQDQDQDLDQDQSKSKISIPSESHPNGKPSGDDVRQVFGHWRSTWNHPKAALDVKRRAAITRALKGYSVADLCASISGYHNSPHHTGQNDKQTVYDDIGLLLRDSAHIDAGLRFFENPQPLTSELESHNVRVLTEWTPSENRNDESRLGQVSGDDGTPVDYLRKGTLSWPD